jgi:UDP-2-acetamido-3-amino-2,3-dideoxy-glucuronate N-acetyltransferase
MEWEVEVGETYIHPTAEVHPRSQIGEGTKIWALSQIREDVRIGAECNIGRNVYIGNGVTLGDRCKVQNNSLLYEDLTIADGVFIGPNVIFTNDLLPRAITPDGALKSQDDWTMGHTHVEYGASIGARSVIITNLTIGRFALVGAGSVVTRDVPPHALVLGNPARIKGYVCSCAHRLDIVRETSDAIEGHCPSCGHDWTLAPSKGEAVR